MNRSYSKIRHIQESNMKLENRLLNEQNSNPGGVPPDGVSWYDNTVKEYLKLGYKEVNTITLPFGLYTETQSGDHINVSKEDGSDTGYVTILQQGGIRGQKEYSVELKPDGTTILDGDTLSKSESDYNNPDNKPDGYIILKK